MIAYFLIVLLTIGAVWAVVLLYRNAPSRKFARRREREEQARLQRSEKLMAQNADADA